MMSNKSPPNLFASDPDEGTTASPSINIAPDATCVAVQVPLAINKAYDYQIPANMRVARGDIVRVLVRNRDYNGVIWDMSDSGAHDKIKPLLHHYDIPPVSQDMLDFIARMANYVLAPRGAVLRLMLRVPKALKSPRPQTFCRLSSDMAHRELLKMTAARARVFACFADAEDSRDEGVELSLSALMRAAKVSRSVVTRLVSDGYLLSREAVVEAVFFRPQYDSTGLVLSPSQNAVASVLAKAAGAVDDQGGFGVHLLDGVTGSGKTEVYFAAIAAALARKRQVLVLLPEIALTMQFLERFQVRFGHPPALWHNALSDAERRSYWRGVARGDIRVLVGARSALFLPWSELGLIVVDEEHDTSFKQEDGVIYNARDMAVLRAQCADCPIILSSATPSLESINNVRRGRYHLHRLPSRYGDASMPQVRLVDMRQNPPARGSWLSPLLIDALTATHTRGAQSLLFLNRRGFAPLVLCRTCGHRYACALCDAWMVEHRGRAQILCHHCGARAPRPRECAECGTADTLVACGPGVERIEHEVRALFPSLSVCLLSSDHVASPAQMVDWLGAIEEGTIDIIIGTQILAKGHHFPYLGFVGVIDADLGLNNGDLRASERTYQLLSQVAGRSGRAQILGEVMMQTYMPTHPVMQALRQIGTGDGLAARDAFIACELAARESTMMPPYGRLAALIISGADADATLAFARHLRTQMPHHDAIQVFGPAPAPITRLRNRYRHRFLIKAVPDAPLHGFLRHWLADCHPPSSIKLAIDVDPYSFM